MRLGRWLAAPPAETFAVQNEHDDDAVREAVEPAASWPRAASWTAVWSCRSNRSTARRRTSGTPTAARSMLSWLANRLANLLAETTTDPEEGPNGPPIRYVPVPDP